MLIENIKFLRKNFPHIRHYYLQNEEKIDFDKVEIIESKRGNPTIKYNTGEKAISVHSLYDPVREGKNIVSRYKEFKKYRHILFYGAGLGYHIEEFLNQHPTCTYSIYEPSPEIFHAFLSTRKLDDFQTNRLQEIHVEFQKNEDKSYLEEFNKYDDVLVVILPGYEQIFKDKIRWFLGQAKKTIRMKKSSFYTNLSFQKRWVLNSLINFRYVAETPNILKDINHKYFKDKPAIITSAGPSLAKDIEHIRYIKENGLAYIFSVGSAINSLLEHDIIPDAVLTYDPGPTNYRVFEKMINAGITNIPMIFGSSVGFETLDKYKGPKIHFITTQDTISDYFLSEQLKKPSDFINDSASIAVMTLQILIKLGCNPIILAGQNLGFLKGKRYSKGIEYDHVSSTVTEKEMQESLEVKNVYGKNIKTKQGFISMKNQLEQYIKMNPEVSVINTTKEGADIQGAPFQEIEKVIIEKLRNKVVDQNCLTIEQNHYSSSGLNHKLDQLYKELDIFMEILKKLENVLKKIAKSLENVKYVELNKYFNQIDECFKLFDQNKFYKLIIAPYNRVFLQYLTKESQIIKNEKNPVKKADMILPLFSKFVKESTVSTYEIKGVLVKLYPKQTFKNSD
ncbi:MAG: motility associated factor glycosyltransferase family protein [Bacillaceae bacterium]|nr:motility associated factor glycosyltransferase family protein [Bacillaceae bacterium]